MRVRTAPQILSLRVLVAFFGVALFAALGLLGMHLHGAVPAAHLQPGVVAAQEVGTLGLAGGAGSVATADAPSAAPHEPRALALGGEGGGAITSVLDIATDPGQTPGHLEAVTACMLAFLVTLVLVVLRTRSHRASRSRQIPRRVVQPPHTSGAHVPTRPLYLFLSISRT